LVRIHDLAEVDQGVTIGSGSSVWQLAHIRENASLGENCIVGRGAYIGSGVKIGSNVKIQNYALIYEPAVIEDGVFIGPAVVLTNDLNPRAVNPDGSLKSAHDWQVAAVHIEAGASIGAKSVCVAPVKIGKWALVGAGSVVVKDVPDFALVVGNPARQIGWVGKSGEKLIQISPTEYRCPKTGELYAEKAGNLEPQN
jgi:UDP-2-acetamido-3-amino-2,3-dideoxy-glucuronate N-acetyltransferase